MQRPRPVVLPVTRATRPASEKEAGSDSGMGMQEGWLFVGEVGVSPTRLAGLRPASTRRSGVGEIRSDEGEVALPVACIGPSLVGGLKTQEGPDLG